jgi:hypothetical protein
MILSGVELVLDFAKSTRLPTPARAVFEALGGQVREGKQPREPIATIRNAKGKTAVRWDYESFNIVQEDVDDIPKCISTFIRTIETVNKVAPIGKVASKTLRAYWILPVGKYDFRNLEVKYRQAFVKDNELFSNCVDSTIVIDMKYDKWKFSHQSGAMNLAQLQDHYRTFGAKEGHAALFFFLATTIIDEQPDGYTKTTMENFLNKSYDICKAHSNKFEIIMEGVL